MQKIYNGDIFRETSSSNSKYPSLDVFVILHFFFDWLWQRCFITLFFRCRNLPTYIAFKTQSLRAPLNHKVTHSRGRFRTKNATDGRKNVFYRRYFSLALFISILNYRNVHMMFFIAIFFKVDLRQKSSNPSIINIIQAVWEYKTLIGLINTNLIFGCSNWYLLIKIH